MKILSIAVALFGLLALFVAQRTSDGWEAGLGIVALICAFTTFRSQHISSFLRIFVAIFAVETIVFGLAVTAGKAELWPEAYAIYLPPDPLPITVAMFSILTYLVSLLPVVRQITQIADRYFNASERGEARVWPLPAYTAPERWIAIAMVVFLVVINQIEVGINVRLSFFNRDWFNSLQNKDEAAFWQQLLFVFTPFVFVLLFSLLTEYVVKSMLVIRWRRWLTEHYVSHWLSDHAHYRMALVGAGADNPDQRISEDVNRFIDGGSYAGAQPGYGIYTFSVLFISTLTSLVSFAVVLWNLSESFTFPLTDVRVPGFMLWVALLYAILATMFTHLIGRPLIALYFIRQRVEASFRFAMARLREYSEQVALLDGEPAEQATLLNRFSAIVDNFLALISRNVKLLAFTQSFQQMSAIIPFVFTAPFYFAGKIELGVMTQATQAFSSVSDALTLFVNYYNSLADFKAVVDRLTSFDAAIENAKSLATAGPARLADAAKVGPVAIENLDIALPDGRHIVETPQLAFQTGQSVLLAGPSGSGKSTFFRAVSGIWPFGGGRVHIPEGADVMVVPQKPYIPIGTLRTAVTYPAPVGSYADDDIRKALADAHLGFLAADLDRDENWSQRLSGGEQQRLAIARALLKEPDWLFLDESTSALDEKLEADLYHALSARLPKTTIVSIGHRSTLGAFHKRRLDMTEDGDGMFTPRDSTAQAAE